MADDFDLWGNILKKSSENLIAKTDYPEIVYDIAFSMDETITPLEKMILFSKYHSTKAILSLERGTLKNILGRGWSGSKYNPEKMVEDSLKMQDFITKSNIKVLRFDSPEYPEGLKQIPDCPFLIYYKGNLKYNYDSAIGFVGTRHPSELGSQIAKCYADFFANNGLTIVSGLALGVDSISHTSACQAHKQTIAVLGCGIDRIYPVANKELARDILDNGGAIVSEYPPGVAAAKWRFPHRNRIIVGLSRGVFVAQAPIRSGSLITAFLTTDYNRDLFVAPSVEQDEIFSGNVMLIEKGAMALNKPQDIFEEWKF